MLPPVTAFSSSSFNSLDSLLKSFMVIPFVLGENHCSQRETAGLHKSNTAAVTSVTEHDGLENVRLLAQLSKQYGLT
jgi:hypothetical protein